MTRQRLRLVRSRPRPLREVERHVLRVLPRLTEQGLRDVLITLRQAERSPRMLTRKLPRPTEQHPAA